MVVVPLGFRPDTVNTTAATPVIKLLPLGISFMGTAFNELKLIQYAFAYEQATHNRLRRLAFSAAIKDAACGCHQDAKLG